MKTTIDIPEPLYKQAKIRAVERGQTLRVLMLSALSENSGMRAVCLLNARRPSPSGGGFCLSLCEPQRRDCFARLPENETLPR
ncbi:MAG: hypothetical protein H7A47_08880 [Verrucomicrobiales bacterium]|nr:hypothetical protein [Verrucomicrobiales bacterium]